jgi:hypothetical protein
MTADSVSGLTRRLIQVAKRKIICRLGFISDQKFYLDSAIVKPRADVGRIAKYCGAVDLEFLLPVDGSKTRNIYRPRFVYALADSTVDPISNAVHDANGQFIAESSSWLTLRQFYSWPLPQINRPRTKLSGEFIFLPNNGYYHWLIEDLPVFLKSLAIAPRAKVLLPRNAASYVREVANLIDNEVVTIGSPVRVERLVMTAKTAGMGSPFGGLTPHPADVAILREFFAKYRDAQPGDRKLYLSRLGQKRSPANEHILQSSMEKQGFVTVDGSRMTLLSQISLFSSATHLVGIHGAAFANVVWAPEGVQVNEIFSSDYMPSCYSALTAIRRGRYTSVSYTPGSGNMMDARVIERLTNLGQVPQEMIVRGNDAYFH